MSKLINPHKNFIEFGTGTSYLLSQFYKHTPTPREQQGLSESLRNIKEQAAQIHSGMPKPVARAYQRFESILGQAEHQIASARASEIPRLSRDYAKKMIQEINEATKSYREKKKLPALTQ